ncbi:hypothetical protein Q3G72_010409 [Acer saccharum]|nr:hypothetical protein Q3G72_003364 [Acer saccharum]KAK1556701.1 hypothetical protein Q3G72_010409 [Acer saccharum]
MKWKPMSSKGRILKLAIEGDKRMVLAVEVQGGGAMVMSFVEMKWKPISSEGRILKLAIEGDKRMVLAVEVQGGGAMVMSFVGGYLL